MKENGKQYLRLFWNVFYISAFTFGGGYVIVPLMKKKFVDELHWLEEEEILDLIAIAQSSPGAIAVNGAVIIGYNVCGLAGAVAAVLGTVLPPLIILSIISVGYHMFITNTIVAAVLKGMQAGIGAVIGDVVWTLGREVTQERDLFSILLMCGAFIASFIFQINIIYIITISAGLGILKLLWHQRKEKLK